MTEIMPRIRPANTALTLFSGAIEPAHFVCRACRAQQQSIRLLHSSGVYAAEETSLFQRLSDSVFGSKQSKELSKQREAAQAAVKPVKERTVRYKAQDYRIAQVINTTEQQTAYQQAYTWENLESIGSEEWVKSQADQGERYIGFATPHESELTGEQWDSLLHTVVVEALLLARTGDGFEPMFKRHNSSFLRSITIVPGKTTSTTELEGLSEELLATIAQVHASKALNSDSLRRKVLAGTLGSSPQLASTWMSTSLDDTSVKFAIVKRILQLTGRRISDSAMSRAKTIQDLRNALVHKEPPKKLAHSDTLKTVNANLPNVTVYDRRRTPIDKDNDLGRWKVIEAELRKRGLPVTGTSWPTAKTTVSTN